MSWVVCPAAATRIAWTGDFLSKNLSLKFKNKYPPVAVGVVGVGDRWIVTIHFFCVTFVRLSAHFERFSVSRMRGHNVRGMSSPPGNPALPWTRNLWSKSLLLILANIDQKIIFLLLFFFFISSFANQPPVHSGGVSRRRICGCGCWRRWQVIGVRSGDRYCWRYPHMLRDSVSPVCGIFLGFVFVI